jgi:hypothetical protein
MKASSPSTTVLEFPIGLWKRIDLSLMVGSFTFGSIDDDVSVSIGAAQDFELGV